MGSKPLAALVLAGLALMQTACIGIARHGSDLDLYLGSDQADKALELLEKRRRVSRNEILYQLDKAMLLRMQQRYEASSDAFEQAKKVIARLEAVSLREQAASITVNDSMRSYLPRPFERALIHCFQAMNYLELRQYDGARVEILQLDEYLKQQKDFELPFARYLSGLVFESNQEPDNAMVAYRKAYEAYGGDNRGIPRLLQQDLLRLSDYLGLLDEHRRYVEEFALEQWPTQQQLRQQARAVAILFNGLVPRKHSHEIVARSPADGQLHRISTPFYEQRQTRVYSALFGSDPAGSAAELFADLGQQARAALGDEMPGIIARTVARAAVKNKVVDNTADQDPLLGLALNLAAFLSEQADTRAWYTLPQEILLARLELEPGLHDLRLRLSGSSRADAGRGWQQVELKPGETLFFGLHWPESYSTLRSRYQ